jgi:hypothetical protein
MIARLKHLLENITAVHQATNTLICKFYEESNECAITDNLASEDSLTLHIITHGAAKQEKLELRLPPGIFYDVLEV